MRGYVSPMRLMFDAWEVWLDREVKKAQGKRKVKRLTEKAEKEFRLAAHTMLLKGRFITHNGRTVYLSYAPREFPK